MLPTATIVFREILEIALVLGIIMAATRGMKSRSIIAIIGLSLGFLGAGIIALFTDKIAQAIDGVGQEIFNASILFIAVAFLGWTVIWMKKHGRELTKNLNAMGQDVKAGRKSIFVLIGVIAFATFREGSEIVLFSFGMLSSNSFTILEFISGCLIGLIGGTVIGFMLYFGLLKAFKHYVFSVTSWMLIFLTAGMAAKGAGFLIAAGLLPELYAQVWDTSSILSTNNIIGETLNILIGYSAHPTGMELAFYLTALISLSIGYKMVSHSSTSGDRNNNIKPSSANTNNASLMAAAE